MLFRSKGVCVPERRDADALLDLQPPRSGASRGRFPSFEDRGILSASRAGTGWISSILLGRANAFMQAGHVSQPFAPTLSPARSDRPERSSPVSAHCLSMHASMAGSIGTAGATGQPLDAARSETVAMR